MDRTNFKEKILFQLSSLVNVDCLHLLCCLILHRMADHWEHQEAATDPNRNSRSEIEGPSETIPPWCNYLPLLDKCQSAFKLLSKQNVKKKLRCLFSKLETLPQESMTLFFLAASNDSCRCRVMSSDRHQSKGVPFLHHEIGFTEVNYFKNYF